MVWPSAVVAVAFAAVVAVGWPSAVPGAELGKALRGSWYALGIRVRAVVVWSGAGEARVPGSGASIPGSGAIVVCVVSTGDSARRPAASSRGGRLLGASPAAMAASSGGDPANADPASSRGGTANADQISSRADLGSTDRGLW